MQAFFEGKKELFKGLAIEELEKEWNEFPVLRIDFTGKKYSSIEDLYSMLDKHLAAFEAQYGIKQRYPSMDLRFQTIIEAAYRCTGRQVVILIDEYDKPLLDVMNTGIASPVVEGEVKTLEDYNREILKVSTAETNIGYTKNKHHG